MKSISCICVILFAVVFSGYANDDRITTDVNELPVESRAFLNQWFEDIEVVRIKIDRKLLGVDNYEVLLANGTEIEFDSAGEWLEIDANGLWIPSGIIPAYVSDYVEQNFKGAKVVAMDREKRGLDVKLHNGLELTFDKSGRLIEIDD